jgi:PPOX class probable F420-dependent enzyme
VAVRTGATGLRVRGLLDRGLLDRDLLEPLPSRHSSIGADMPAHLSSDVRAVIESGRLAHFTTVAADGRPHTTIVWVGLDGDEIVIGKLFADQKVANIRRDPRVSFSMEADGDQHGMQNHLVVEGTARLTEGGAPELLDDLAQRYIGPGTKFPPMDDPPPGFVIRISPTKVRGMGPWGTQL